METQLRFFGATIFFLFVSSFLQAQVTISSVTTPYTQNFNTLKSTSGSSSTLPTGWELFETGSSANISYAVNSGSSTTGNTYSYGTGTNTDRALGGLQTSSLISTIGVQFKNTTGQSINTLVIGFTGEQWRCGTTGRTDQLDFQYSMNATSLSTGTWVDENNLDFISPVSFVVGALDGNAAANRTIKSYTIKNVNIPNNAIFWLRWTDFNAFGADDGLAVDDFSIQLKNQDITPPTAISFTPANGATNISQSGNLIINFNENILKGSAGAITIKQTSDNTIVQSTIVTSSAISVSGSSATIPFSGLNYSSNYYVNIDAGAFTDIAGNNFAGITTSSVWSFTTLAPPTPTLSVNPYSLSFGYVPVNTTSTTQTFSFTTTNIISSLNLNAPTGFEISKDGISFSSLLSFTQTEAQAGQTVFVRFAPATTNTNYSGTINFSSTGLNVQLENLNGNSIPPPPIPDTLKVVNWNIDWFGHTSFGPTDDNLQEQNVKTVMQNINADIYGLAEVVSVSRLQNIVSQMPGYSFIVSDFCSGGSTVSSCASAQKLAFVYRTSIVNKIRTYPMLKYGSSNASYNWSSGRFPYLMEADVIMNGVTKRIDFFMLHGKANTTDYVVSYNRRRAGAAEMHDSLVVQYNNINWVVMGDYNDDLDRTITTQIFPDTTTSYISFKNDPTFYKVTLPLSLAGLKSTVSYNAVIDHVTISTNMNNYYVANSAKILRQQVESWILNYGSTTSDHYPVLTKYILSGSGARTDENDFINADISNTSEQINLSVALSPSQLNLYINDNQERTNSLLITDLTGRIISNEMVKTINGTTKISYDINSLSSGIYLVSLKNNTGMITKKIFINK